MLDRIKQMAEEAGIPMRYPPDYEASDDDVVCDQLTHGALQRLVKLVAEDCAKVVARQSDEHGGQDWYATGCIESERAIRYRYGIKE